MAKQVTIPLTPRERAVFPLYFGRRRVPQREIASLFGVLQPAIAKRVAAIRAKFAQAGVPLPQDAPQRRVRTRSLSGFWDRREYLPLPVAC